MSKNESAQQVQRPHHLDQKYIEKLLNSIEDRIFVLENWVAKEALKDD